MNSISCGYSSIKSFDSPFLTFNTTNSTDMSFVFNDFSSLINIRLSSFNTTSNNYKNKIISICLYLKSIDISSFNTTNVTNTNVNAQRLFFSLKLIDSSEFNITNVTNMNGMSDTLSSLKKENILIMRMVNY